MPELLCRGCQAVFLCHLTLTSMTQCVSGQSTMQRFCLRLVVGGLELLKTLNMLNYSDLNFCHPVPHDLPSQTFAVSFL